MISQFHLKIQLVGMLQLVGERFSKIIRSKLSTNGAKIHFTVIHISMLSIAQPKMKIKVYFYSQTKAAVVV